MADVGDRPEVSILLIGYRTKDELSRCLASVRTADPTVAYEVVLVDNASGDGTAEHIRTHFPEVRVYELAENIGFGRGVNYAASLARGRYLLLLNPDTEVRPGALRGLLECAERHPDAGLIGGRTLTDDGDVEPSCCWGAPTLWSTFCFGTGLSTFLRGNRWFDPEAMPGWDRDSEREVGIVTGCLVLVSQAVWKQLGGFDERFFMYGEDTDLSMRARRAGYRPMITPAAEVIHTIGASSSVPATRRVMIMRGKVTIARLHWRRPLADLNVVLLLAGVGLRAGLGTVKSKVKGSVSPDQESWMGAWQRRAEWVDGYPPLEAPVRPVLVPTS